MSAAAAQCPVVVGHHRRGLWDTYVLNKRTLVLEGVTLGKVVELVVEVLVDLAAGTVLDEQSAKDAETAHPQNLTVIPTLSAFQIQIQSFAPFLSSLLLRNL